MLNAFKKLLAGCFLFFFMVSSFAFETNDKSVIEAGSTWAAALKARDVQQITSLYDKDAYLYATFKNMADSQADIREYFEKLFKHQNLNVVFVKQFVRDYGDVALNSGLYTFSYQDDGAKKVSVPARYTFVYLKTPQGWKIIDHHSSVLPVSSASALTPRP